MGRKKNQLGTQIHQLKKSNDKIFSALASTASRLDAVERVQADADMRVRNLEIKMKSMSGAKNKDIAVEYDLSECFAHLVVRYLSVVFINAVQ